jgi:RNA polymerase sigma-70 factor (ECF subfamily)
MHRPVTDKPSKKKRTPASCDAAELFSQLGSAVYGYALHMLGDPGQAEEVLSETFLRICGRKAQYCGQGSIRGWVLAITRRLCIDVVRLKTRRNEPPGLPETLVSSEPSPLTLTELGERRRIVVAAIEKLPAEQKDVVMLKIYGGLTFREIAEALGVPLSTALGRMQLAIKRLSREPSLSKIGTIENEM